jgi:hypothetical protein
MQKIDEQKVFAEDYSRSGSKDVIKLDQDLHQGAKSFDTKKNYVINFRNQTLHNQNGLYPNILDNYGLKQIPVFG